MQPSDDVLLAVNVEQPEVGIRVSQKVPREIRALRLPSGLSRLRPHRLRLGQRSPPILRVSLKEGEVCRTRDLRGDERVYKYNYRNEED